MYLNVSLTPPQTGAEGSCTTPKTPEILNSIMSLTSPPLPPTYAHYQSQVSAGELLSPVSSTSPCDEMCTTQFGSQTPSSSQHIQSSTNSGSGGSYLITRSKACSVGTASSTGTPSPPVFELPSPVSTVEATKSALIKEGLKHQIRSKLQAAGIGANEIIVDTNIVKEEEDDDAELTLEDEERRRRRRERNKIAATKCRNKKKERTYILMSENEVAEDQNIKLKSEIKRLEIERLQLEKILGDPNHRASCRRHCSGDINPSPPLVIVTPPEARDETPPYVSESLSTCSSSYENMVSPMRESIAGNIGLQYCPTSTTPTSNTCPLEGSYPCRTASFPSLEYTLPPSSLPDAFPQLSSHTVPISSSVVTHCNTLSIGSPLSESPHLIETINKNGCVSEPSIEDERETSRSNELVPNHTITSAKRTMPYQVVSHSNTRETSTFSVVNSNMHSNTLNNVPNETDCYFPVASEDEKNPVYVYSYQSSVSDKNHSVNSEGKNLHVMGKARSLSCSRYTPYNKGSRGTLPTMVNAFSNMTDGYYEQDSCSQATPNLFMTESPQNHFYPPCNY